MTFAVYRSLGLASICVPVDRSNVATAGRIARVLKAEVPLISTNILLQESGHLTQ